MLALDILEKRIRSSNDVVSDQHHLKQFLSLQLGDCQHETFGAVFLDSMNRVVGFEHLFKGTLNHTSVYPREVIKVALRCNAAGAILYHNHPSGSAIPSEADITLTRRLGNILKFIDVQLLDHIIIAGHKCSTFSEDGIMPTFDLVV